MSLGDLFEIVLPEQTCPLALRTEGNVRPMDASNNHWLFYHIFDGELPIDGAVRFRQAMGGSREPEFGCILRPTEGKPCVKRSSTGSVPPLPSLAFPTEDPEDPLRGGIRARCLTGAVGQAPPRVSPTHIQALKSRFRDSPPRPSPGSSSEVRVRGHPGVGIPEGTAQSCPPPFPSAARSRERGVSAAS